MINRSLWKTGRFTLLVLLFLSMGSLHAGLLAQEVSGTVLDENGNPLPGVNVVVTGTSTGTITDLNGEYTLTIDARDASLTFSFVGYRPLTVEVGNRTVVDVQMELETRELEDVVVIGYGTVQKNDLTGAVGVVDADEINKTPTPSVGKALQGRISGVTVTQAGDPGGENYNIRVRGIGSITQSPDPLVVVDGVIVGGLGSVPPEDIESISVLKDASASAIYGANGANGVILVTTKRGKGEEVDVSFSAYTGMNVGPKQFDMMNADQYADFYNAVYDATTTERQFAYSDEFRRWYYGDGWQEGTDWQEEILQKSHTNNVHLGVSQGGEKANYSISLNVFDEEGILLNTNSRRYNFRANSDFQINKYIKIGESLSLKRSKWRTGNGSAWGMALESSPLMKVYNPANKEGFEGSQNSILWDPDGDGIGNDADGDGEADYISNTGANDKFNPRGMLAIPEDMHYSDNLMGKIYMEITPTPWLTFTTTPSITAYFAEHNDWVPAYDMGPRSVTAATLAHNFNKGSTYSLENKLSFDHTFGDHYVNAIAVQQYRYGDYANSSVDAAGFPYEQLNVISQSDPEGRVATGGRSDFSFAELAYLARLIYNYQSRYLLTASYRIDGSSNFGPGNRIGRFPSFSVAWKLNEDLLRQVDEINMLKLRAGWGITGNADIGGFRYQTSLAEPVHFSPVFGVNQEEATALNELWTVGNPLIRWEGARMTNIGADLNAFGNKLQFSTEYYIKNSDGLLLEVPVSTAHGKWSDHGAFYNIGKITNRGFEFDLRYSNMEGQLNYNAFVNLTTIKNEVVELPDEYLDNYNLTREGHTIGSLYGWVAEGIIQESDFDEEGNYLHAEPAEGTPAPGDLRFRDLNNDGAITDADRTIIGKAVPDLVYSFGVDFYYRNFDLSVFFFGMHNVQVFNTQRRDIESFATQDLDHNKAAGFGANYYREDQPSTEYLRLDPTNANLNTRISTWWVEDASFLRIKDVQLGYEIPASVTKSINLEQLRVYVSGSNLLTFTKYTGYDPESPLNTDEPTLPGVDDDKYPLPRTVTAGIQINF